MSKKGLLLILIGLVMVVTTFQQTAYLRYIFPAYVILGAAIGLLLSADMVKKNSPAALLVLPAAVMAIVLNLVFFKSGSYTGTIAR